MDEPRGAKSGRRVVRSAAVETPLDLIEYYRRGRPLLRRPGAAIRARRERLARRGPRTIQGDCGQPRGVDRRTLQFGDALECQLSLAVTVPDFPKWKSEQRKISVLTAYDYPTARLLDSAGVDCILVGDSLGTAVQGWETTLRVTLGQMIYHTEMVARAARRVLVIADLPFLSFQVSPGQAVRQPAGFSKRPIVRP